MIADGLTKGSVDRSSLSTRLDGVMRISYGHESHHSKLLVFQSNGHADAKALDGIINQQD